MLKAKNAIWHLDYFVRHIECSKQKQLRNELEQAKSDGTDRASLSEYEQARFTRRESELKEQLEEVYKENAQLQEQLHQSSGNRAEEGGVPDQCEQIVALEERIQSLESQLSSTTDKLTATEELLRIEPEVSAYKTFI